MAKKYVLDGYLFANAADFERAKKEQETIQYLTANPEKTDRFRCGRKRLVRTNTGADCHGEESKRTRLLK